MGMSFEQLPEQSCGTPWKHRTETVTQEEHTSTSAPVQIRRNEMKHKMLVFLEKNPTQNSLYVVLSLENTSRLCFAQLSCVLP